MFGVDSHFYHGRQSFCSLSRSSPIIDLEGKWRVMTHFDLKMESGKEKLGNKNGAYRAKGEVFRKEDDQLQEATVANKHGEDCEESGRYFRVVVVVEIYFRSNIKY